MPRIQGMWHVRHYGADGALLDQERGHNIFHDEGEQSLAQLFSGEYTWPASFYVGCDNRVGNSYAVAAVTTGTGGSFDVSGDVTTECTAGEPLRVVGSTGNNGVYTIASASYDGSTYTTITVEESVPDSTADGTVDLFAVTEADTLAGLAGEPGGANGYARQGCAVGTTDWTASQVDGDWQAQTVTKTITASGGSIGPLNTLFLCTSSDNTGRLFQTKVLRSEKTLNDGESLDVSLYTVMGE